MYDCEVFARMLGVPVFMGTHGLCYTGGCQNHGPFLDPYYETAPNIQATEKRTIILTTSPYAIGGTCLKYHLSRWCCDGA